MTLKVNELIKAALHSDPLRIGIDPKDAPDEDGSATVSGLQQVFFPFSICFLNLFFARTTYHLCAIYDFLLQQPLLSLCVQLSYLSFYNGERTVCSCFDLFL